MPLVPKLIFPSTVSKPSPWLWEKKVRFTTAEEDEENVEEREGWETLQLDGQTVVIRTSAIEEKCQVFVVTVLFPWWCLGGVCYAHSYVTILRKIKQYAHPANGLSQLPSTHQLHQLRNRLFLPRIPIQMFRRLSHKNSIMRPPYTCDPSTQGVESKININLNKPKII